MSQIITARIHLVKQQGHQVSSSTPARASAAIAPRVDDLKQVRMNDLVSSAAAQDSLVEGWEMCIRPDLLLLRLASSPPDPMMELFDTVFRKRLNPSPFIPRQAHRTCMIQTNLILFNLSCLISIWPMS